MSLSTIRARARSCAIVGIVFLCSMSITSSIVSPLFPVTFQQYGLFRTFASWDSSYASTAEECEKGESTAYGRSPSSYRFSRCCVRQYPAFAQVQQLRDVCLSTLVAPSTTTSQSISFSICLKVTVASTQRERKGARSSSSSCCRRRDQFSPEGFVIYFFFRASSRVAPKGRQIAQLTPGTYTAFEHSVAPEPPSKLKTS